MTEERARMTRQEQNERASRMLVYRLEKGRDTWEAFDARIQEIIATNKRCAAIAYNAQDMHERVWKKLQAQGSFKNP